MTVLLFSSVRLRFRVPAPAGLVRLPHSSPATRRQQVRRRRWVAAQTEPEWALPATGPGGDHGPGWAPRSAEPDIAEGASDRCESKTWTPLPCCATLTCSTATWT